MHLFWILIVTLIVVFIVKTLLRMYQLNQYVKNIPMIPISAMLRFVLVENSPVDVFNHIRDAMNIHDGLAKFFLGTQLLVMCDDPENMKLMLMSKNCTDKPFFYRFVTSVGDGLFSSSGDRWKVDRKQINTVFSLGNLKAFIPIFRRHLTHMTNKLEATVNQPEFDMMFDVFSCNYDIVCDTNLRFDMRSRNHEKAEDFGCMARMWKIVGKRVSSVSFHWDFWFRFSSLHTEELEILDRVRDIANQVIQNINNVFASTADTNDQCDTTASITCDDNSPTKSTILIDKLFEMKRQGLIDDAALKDQVNTFIIAGTDTSSITMLSLLLMLAMHDDVQQCAYEEITKHVPDIETLDYDTLTKLDYIERVIKETMRMFPLPQALIREAEEDIQLTECVAPKGAYLVLNIFKMHRSTDIWGATANEFIPDRFLPESMADRHPFAYVPFSAGPRNCIGYKYAMITMKMLVCHLLQAFRLSTSLKMSDIVLEFDGMIRMHNPCLVKFDRRKGNV